jgi:uncharacterized membrane protein
MENYLAKIITYVVPVVEACGSLVIVIEAVRTMVRLVWRYLRRDGRDMRGLRIRLGQAMVMGLEFQVAADILKTAASPQWNDILLLAALIALRTLLNFLLERELKGLKDEIAQKA